MPLPIHVRTTTSASTDTGANRTHATLLWLLLGLFLFRVVAQLAAALTALPFLPPFEARHSGALRYHLRAA